MSVQQRKDNRKSRFIHLKVDFERLLTQWKAADGDSRYRITWRGRPIKNVGCTR